MGKKHKGNGTGNAAQGTGRRRGPETGNGYTASTGHGRPSGVEYQGGKPSLIGQIVKIVRGKK